MLSQEATTFHENSYMYVIKTMDQQSTPNGKPRTHAHKHRMCNVYTASLPELYFGLFQSLNLMFILSLVTVRKLPSQHQAS